MTDREYIKALESLKEALDLYYAAEHDEKLRKALRDSCIQRFEYSIELSWKLSMKLLGSNVKAAKPAIREMARNDLISSPALWFSFIDARNSSSHSYDENVARNVFSVIEKFYPEAVMLGKKLEDLI
jgi:nucleotidyltransferase substrate binding protein (TIGR01987 family)